MACFTFVKTVNVEKERTKKLYRAFNDRLNDKEEYYYSITTGETFENSTESRV